MGRLSEAQKGERRKGIGSSDVAEMLGMSPYEGASPMRLFVEKTGTIQSSEDEDEEDIALEMGHLVEPAVIAMYERQSGFKVLTKGPFVESVVHPRHPFMRANLDGRIRDKRAAVEVKFVGMGMHRQWDLLADDGIPNYVRLQVAHQMACADLDEVHVAALVAGPSGFRVWYVPRDLELEAMIETECVRFWGDHILARVPPPLDATSASRKYLDAKYPPKPADVEVEAPPELWSVGDERLWMQAQEKAGKEAKDMRSNLIIEAMGKAGATVMWCQTWRATYRQNAAGKRVFTHTASGPGIARGRRATKSEGTEKP
jgi:putative phage-type endonuclease